MVIYSILRLRWVQIHWLFISYYKVEEQQGHSYTELTERIIIVAHLLHILLACETLW